MPADPAVVKALFLEAAAIGDPVARAALVNERCGDDAAVRARVNALLVANDQAVANERIAAFGGADGSEATPTADFSGKDEHVGAVLAGRYKLVEEIGEGGMGSVYMAQQTVPVKRAVAVKVIKAGMDSKAVLARFEAERQALALMDHPNIARVLDAGTTVGGRPFFVMELVKGVPITQFCDERKLTPRQRLELFVPVCQAIQHAHQKGIIHRDLKPSNVMIALYDDRAVPKVIDFGVAKATGQSLTDRTLMTGFGAVVGTPEYMSPEQANLNNLDIDTRSDVYSLGVLLYELLTGTTPVDRKSLGKAALLEILRIVREIEVPRPSLKLSTIDTLPSVAANRGTEPAKLSKLMKGELDWVVLKALEKDRGRRYETANGLARDIQRYLVDEVVEARPPSAGYRLTKFVRRHQGRVLAASLVLFALVAGIAGTTWGLIEARQQEQEAIRQGAAANEQRRLAQEKEQEALRSQQRAENARTEADQHRNLLRVERDKARLNLYFAEMTLAGIGAEAPVGIGQVRELLSRWGPAAPGADLRGWEWYYLDGQARQAALTLRGHVGPVRAVAYTRDGKRLATGGHDTTVRIWDTATGREIACLRGHTQSVRGVAWSPDGGRLATASADGTARIWDATTGQELHRLCGPGAPVTAVAWRPDGARLATTGHDLRFHVWDTDTGREVIGPKLGGSWGLAVAWSPDGKRLAAGTWGRGAVVDGETGTILISLKELGNGVTGVSWSPSGERLATASQDGGGTVHVWDPSTGQKMAVLRQATESYLSSVCWSPDGKQLAAGGGNRVVQVWDAQTGRAHAVLRGNLGEIHALAWSPDGASLAATSDEGIISSWDVGPGSSLARARARDVTAETVFDWTRDGRTVTRSGDATLRVWEPAQTKPSVILRGELTKEVGPGSVIQFSPDGTRIATADWAVPVRIWNATSGDLLRTLQCPGHSFNIRWSPDGARIAGSGFGWVTVWDVRSGDGTLLEGTQPGIPGQHRALCWSPSGDRIATAGTDAPVRVWDATSGRLLARTSYKDDVRDVTWSPDGGRIASSGPDGIARIWDAATGGEVLSLRGHSGQVRSIGWSPDGKRIATGSTDRTVKLWDPVSGRESLTLRGHGETVTRVHWHPDGCRLATQDATGQWLIWDATPAFLGERSPTILPELDERIRRDPADATARRHRAEVLARQGDWDAAASEFAELARLPASAAAVYPAGWWALAGPADQPPPFPPPVGATPARWLAPADDPNGFVGLPADETTAVSRVFAPRRKMVALDIGPIRPGRFWLNEKAIGALGTGPILVQLREGWNSLAVRGGRSELFVRWRDFDKPPNPAERMAFARAAALAVAGQGKIEPPLDDAAKAKLRGQALAWLKAELAVWTKQLESVPPRGRSAIVLTLRQWQKDPDLAGLRDAAALAKLPAQELQAFTQFWADVTALLKQAEEKPD
jgi:WD40 repeat protein